MPADHGATDAPKDATPARPKSSIWNWLRIRGLRAWDWLGRMSGDRIPRPHARRMLKHHRAKDAEANRELTPAPDSHVVVEGVWAFEAFTPSNIDAVLTAMRKKGWDQKYRRTSQHDLVGWLRAIRKEGGLGSHAVWLKRPKDVRIMSVAHVAELPAFAELAVGELVNITPSVGGLCLFFRLKPGERGRIEAALRATYETKVMSMGDGLTHVSPRLARQAAVEAIRLEWRAQIAAWFAAHAPGVFSEGDDQDRPTCELVIGENFTLFEVGGDHYDKIAEAAGTVYSSWLFEEEKGEGMMFAPMACRSETLENHAILAGTRESFEGRVHSLNQPAGDDRHAFGADEDFRDSFIRWALLQVISVYHERVNEARDEAARIFSSRKPLPVLKRLQHLTTTLGDTAILTREMTAFADGGLLSMRSGYDLFVRPHRPREEPRTYLNYVHERLKRTVESLRLASSELDTFIAAQGNLTNARANLELQNIVFGFGLVGLAFGVVSGIEAGGNLWQAHGPATVQLVKMTVGNLGNFLAWIVEHLCFWRH